MNDLHDFQEDVTWYFEASDDVEVISSDPVALTSEQRSDAFTAAFPRLALMLSKARRTRIRKNEEFLELWGWTNREGASFGWLCHVPGCDAGAPLIDDHRLQLAHMGGIVEKWNEPSSYLMNLNWAFGIDECRKGFQAPSSYVWMPYYLEQCKEAGLEPWVDPLNYQPFAVEANGNVILYHLRCGEVIMFAHDHAFRFVDVLRDCPEYTFYSIRGCPTFRDWVEAVADQWLVAM